MNKIIFQNPTKREIGANTKSNIKYYVSCNYKNSNKTYYLQLDGALYPTCTNGWFDTKEEAEKAIVQYKENK